MRRDLLHLHYSRHISDPPGSERQTSASSSQAAVQKDLDHIFRLLLRQHNAESLISSRTDVFVNILRVDHTAVPQRHPVLFLIEIRLIKWNDLICLRGLIVEKTGNNPSF